MITAIQDNVNRVVREWGFVQPKVHVAYRIEIMAYMVSVVFAMRWEINWMIDPTGVKDILTQLLDDMGEDWAVDARIPLSTVEL